MNKHIFIALALAAAVVGGCKEKNKEQPKDMQAMLCGNAEFRAKEPATCKDWEKYLTAKPEATDLMKKLSE